MQMAGHLWCFGLGYVARRVAARALQAGWRVGGTVRQPAALRETPRGALSAVQYYAWDSATVSPTMASSNASETPAWAEAWREVTHVFISIPPQAEGQKKGDPAWLHYGAAMAALPALQWVGYCSTTGVYGDYDGAWVDETSPLRATEPRSLHRITAEQQWLAATPPATLFRLAGIYGPGRSAIDDVRRGTAQAIVKPGQFFSRIHAEDAADIVWTAMRQPRSVGEIFNVCDDAPAPSYEVVEYAAQLLGVAPPPRLPFESAQLSPMARSFYAANRRVKNQKAKDFLGVSLRYPTYREGLAAILQASHIPLD